MRISDWSSDVCSSDLYQSPVFSLYLFPSDDDFSKYSGSNFETFNATRGLYVQNWPYIRNEASTNQNPYWITNRNLNHDLTSRILSSFKIKDDFTDWLNLQVRATYDVNNNSGDARNYAGTDPVTAGSAGELSGSYSTRVDNITNLYSDALLNATGNLSAAFLLTGTLVFSNIKFK